MGGGSKSQTIGYKYYLGMHLVFVHGPVDFLLRILVDNRSAWVGALTGGQVNINAPNLFGGEEREGGVVGAVDFAPGAPDQTPNDYLQSQLGAVPAFRGVAALILRKVYLAMNPYLKRWAARMQRIHVTSGGAVQWYDAKAAIPPVDDFLLPGDAGGWEYQILAYHSDPGNTNLTQPASGWITGAQAPFGGGTTSGGTNTNWPIKTILWARRSVEVPTGNPRLLTVEAENGCVVFVNGIEVGSVNRSNVQIGDNQNNTFQFTLPAGATSEVAVKGFDEVTPSGGGTYLRIRLEAPGAFDMNPAHIIRECLVDANWGMGYQAADIDDEAFQYAADLLYNEGFGISLLWDRQVPIEDFIKEVLKHIDAALYVTRDTGKFKLRLVRDDFVKAELLHLNDGNVEKVDNFSRPLFGELVNSITVNYWDTMTGKTASITVQDIAMVQTQGATINTTLEYPGITRGRLASRVASRDLKSLSAPIITCTVYANAVGADLELGEPFVLDWPEYGVEDTVMRVTNIAFGDGKTSKVRIICTQDTFSLPDTVFAPPPDTEWGDPTNAVPVAAEPRAAYEVPYGELVQVLGQSELDAALADNPDRGYVQVAGGRPGSGFLHMLLMTDSGAGYESYGVVDFCPYAYVVGAADRDLEAIPTGDTSDTSLVAAGSYGKWDNEWVKVESFGSGVVNVKRAVLDSVPEEHADGSVIMFVDGWAGSDNVEYVATEVVSAKLLTLSGSGQLSEGAAPANSVTLVGRASLPYPPANVKIGGSYWPSSASGTFAVTWAHRNRFTQADTLVSFKEASITPAPNTRYALRFLDASDALLVERLDIGPGTASVVLNYTGDVTMELYTIDNTGASLQKHTHVFSYTPPGGPVTSTITATAYTPVDDSTIIDGGP